MDPLVNVAETGQYSRKGMDPLVIQPNVLETSQYLQKGVHSQLRQPIFSELGQHLRKAMIDLNQSQEIESSLNLLHQENLQIQNPMETPHPSNNINLNEVQGHSYVTKPQKNQWPKNVMEKAPSDYVQPMVYAINVGALRCNTPHLSNVKVNSAEMIQAKEKQFRLFDTNTKSQQKPSNGVKVSASVPTGRGLHHGEGSNLENHKLVIGQSPGSLQKRRTISDIKSSTMDLKCWNEWSRTSKKATGKEHISKGIESLNPYFSEGMPEIQSLKLQERPLTPCNNHPSIYMDGKQSIFNESFLSHHQLMKESSGVHMSCFAVVQSSGQPIPYFNDQVSLGQEKKIKLQQVVSSSGLLHTTCKEELRGFIGGALSSKVVPLQEDNVSKSLYMKGPVSLFSFRNIPEKDPPCLFNQNPADIAEVDDERYLRSVEDQRIWDKSSFWEKSGVVNVDGRKRQRTKERPGRMPVVALKSQLC
ncbi:hypothetical protein HAX54_005591 [Datura stramonium]|uniref:DUF3741 domain-containing protein n=1 Tax=Datura stramonium TaxID=4076 RepID=A0ABS8TA83_DATST|nr:hypothetical protein [Datura stramonium]